MLPSARHIPSRTGSDLVDRLICTIENTKDDGHQEYLRGHALSVLGLERVDEGAIMDPVIVSYR